MNEKDYAMLWQCGEVDAAILNEGVGDELMIDAGRHRKGMFQLYDSFECSVIDSGRALIRSQGRFRLVDVHDLVSNGCESEEMIRHHRPVFWWEFEEGAFKAELKKRLKLRAASLISTVNLNGQEWLVRNGDGKIILRLWHETWSVEGREAHATLQSYPLQGYEWEAESLSDRISNHAAFQSSPTSLMEGILRESGRAERPHSPKDIIDLRGDHTVQGAVTHMAQVMLQITRQNEAGMVADIDSEFLHDYRVAIRKLRSVILLVKGAYPRENVQWLKKELGDMARATNRHRDLDVYLLAEKEYKMQLPIELREGLDQMFADFKAERSRVKGKTVRRITSERYEVQMSNIVTWLSQNNLPKGKRADLEIGKVVEKELLKHMKYVRRLGSEINAETPDAEVHELRIECKKLRYLLELFASLMNQKPYSMIMKRLKGLQNVLGDFNDYSVQKENMIAYLENANTPDRRCAAAIGGLIVVLDRKQLEARALVEARFVEFCDGKMGQRFEALFKQGETA